MKVDLISNDEGTVLKSGVEIPDFPNSPDIIVWNKKAFTSTFGYGQAATQYQEQDTLFLED